MALLADTILRTMKEVVVEFLFVTVFPDVFFDVSNLSQWFIVLPDIKQNGEARELIICFKKVSVRAAGTDL